MAIDGHAIASLLSQAGFADHIRPLRYTTEPVEPENGIIIINKDVSGHKLLPKFFLACPVDMFVSVTYLSVS